MNVLRLVRATRALAVIWTLSILITTQLIPSRIVSAEDEIPPDPANSRLVQTTEDDGDMYTIVSQSAKVNQSRPKGGITPDAASFQVGSHWVEYANCFGRTGSSKCWHCYARTKKLSGSGTYKTHAHAAFIEGDGSGVSYEDEVVFGVHTHGCAWKDTTNATSTTCESPHFDTFSGQWWYVVSGHQYDVGANGWDHECAGCIDWPKQIP
jgi:hypothetical protein